MADTAPGAEHRFLTFRLGGALYALPAEEISEVIRMPPVARLPHGPRGLLGVGNLRGRVLPIASGRGLLGQKEAQASRAIVLSGAAPVAIAVDRVEALVKVEGERIATQAVDLASAPGERLRGAFPAGGSDGVAKILDVRPLLEAAFVQAPRAPRTAAAAPPDSRAQVAEPGADGGGERLVTFEAAGQEFGLPLTSVREIIAAPAQIVSAPRSDAVVAGVSSYRDGLLPVLSLRALLGLPAAAAAEDRNKVLVVAIGPALAGILVDGVRAILTAEPGELEPTPALIAARTAGESQIRAIYRGEAGQRLVSVLSLDRLLREDVMSRLAAGASGAGSEAEPSAGAEEELRFLVFRLGDEAFALPIGCVVEVARVPDQITRLPKTPKFLEGVINIRGEVLPVVDQRRRFDLPPSPNPEARRLVVVRTAQHRAGLIVDSVSEVLRSTAAAVEPAPDLTGEATRLVQGVINLDAPSRLVLLLDPAELLTRAERSLLEAFQTDTSQDAT